MNLHPAMAWSDALGVTPHAPGIKHTPWQNAIAVSESLHLPECAVDAGAPHHRGDRKLLAMDYLWNGDVDKAAALVCDMLCHPAPAGFRSLLVCLLEMGQMKALANSGSTTLHVGDTLQALPMPNPLSAREMAVLRLISTGHCNKSIARQLHMAPETVKCHAKKIFFKLSTRTRAEAVARAAALGIL